MEVLVSATGRESEIKDKQILKEIIKHHFYVIHMFTLKIQEKSIIEIKI